MRGRRNKKTDIARPTEKGLNLKSGEPKEKVTDIEDDYSSTVVIWSIHRFSVY